MEQGGHQQSEVARIRQQIQAELTAANTGMYAFAEGVARHAFIDARMDRVAGLQSQLGHLVGPDESIRMVLDDYTSSI